MNAQASMSVRLSYLLSQSKGLWGHKGRRRRGMGRVSRVNTAVNNMIDDTLLKNKCLSSQLVCAQPGFETH